MPRAHNQGLMHVHGGPARHNQGRAFSPFDLFAGGESGFYYPTRDLTALFLSSQGETGNVAALDDQIGLMLDKRLMGGASAAAFMAAQPELRGAGAIGMIGSATPATYNPATGEITASRVDSSNQSYVQWSGLSGLYQVTIQNTGSVTASIRGGGPTASALQHIGAGNTVTAYVTAAGGQLTLVATNSGTTAQFIVQSFKEIPGNHASQATGTARPKYKPAFPARWYDATDDCHQTTAVCGSGGNTIALLTATPESVASAQHMMGAYVGGANARFLIGINTDGNLIGGVGEDSPILIKGAADIRGQTGVAILVEDGINVFLYWNDSLVYSGARNGSPPSAVIYEGALNNSGSPSNFFGGGIHESLFIQRALTPDEIAKLTNFWS